MRRENYQERLDPSFDQRETHRERHYYHAERRHRFQYNELSAGSQGVQTNAAMLRIL